MGAEELTSWKVIAHALGVNVRTYQKWERERGLPIRRTNGGRVSITRADLQQWQERILHTDDPCCFRWPLGPAMMAELRFVGGAPHAEHIERLLQYLTVTKNALTS